MQGFSTSVAIVIGFSQMDAFLGLTNLPKSSNQFIKIYNIVNALGDTKYISLIYGLVTLLFLMFTTKKFPKIPWVVIVCVVGAIFGMLKIGNVPTLGDKFGDLSLQIFDFSYSNNTSFDNGTLIFGGFLLAFVGSLETLISAKIADSMRIENPLEKIPKEKCVNYIEDNKSRIDPSFRQDWEMLGMSITNFLSGLFGSMSVTGVFLRTAINTQNGAVSQVSQF